MLEQIKSLEKVFSELPQFDLDECEYFMGSLYVRKIIIPAGVAITSRVYKRSYVDIMISGDITISDTNGTYRLEGFNLLEGTPGRKRAGFAHKDTVWVTVHDPVDIKDNPKEDISFKTIEEHSQYRKLIDNAGYENILLAHGITEGQVQEEMRNVPAISEGIKESSIHGMGVFAERRHLPGEIIGKTMVSGVKTKYGRYINHSEYPNCIIRDDEVVCIRAMDKDHELTINYADSPRLRGKL